MKITENADESDIDCEMFDGSLVPNKEKNQINQNQRKWK